MYIPAKLSSIVNAVPSNANTLELELYKREYLKSHTLVEWYKLYDSAMLQVSAKVFPQYADEVSVSSDQVHHNED